MKQNVVQWAKTVTPKRFVLEAVGRLSGPRPTTVRNALIEVVERVKQDKQMSRAYEMVFGYPEIFEVIGRRRCSLCRARAAEKAKDLVKKLS